jgi:phage host-nuclease inhibitor protein Gam
MPAQSVRQVAELPRACSARLDFSQRLAVCGADGSGSDLGGEYARQRNYLEKTIESLKRKLAADAEAHRTDELRIMGQNVSLIRELNELRREIKVRPAAH